MRPERGGAVEFRGSQRNYTLRLKKNAVQHTGTVRFEIDQLVGDTTGVSITARDSSTEQELPRLRFNPGVTLMMNYDGCTSKPIIARRQPDGSLIPPGKSTYPGFLGLNFWLKSVHLELDSLSVYALAVP